MTIGSHVKCLGAPNNIYIKGNLGESYMIDIDGILTVNGISNKKFDISGQVNMTNLEDALKNGMFKNKEKKEVSTKDKLDSIFQKIDSVGVKTDFFENSKYKEDFLFLYNNFSEMSSENMGDLLEILLAYLDTYNLEHDLSEIMSNGIKAETINGVPFFIIKDHFGESRITYHK